MTTFRGSIERGAWWGATQGGRGIGGSRGGRGVVIRG